MLRAFTPTSLFAAAAKGSPTLTPELQTRLRHKPGRSSGSARGCPLGTGRTAHVTKLPRPLEAAVLSRDTPADKAGGHAKQGPHPQAGCASTGEGAQLRSAGAEGWAAGRRHRGSPRGKRSKHSAGPREPGRGEGLTPGNRGVSPTGRGYVWPTRTAAPSALQWRGGDGILGACAPTVPALLMAGRAPFSAHRRFPPKGTYCWEEGRLSALSSCRRCLSRRMECTAFRKSLRLLGELWRSQALGKLPARGCDRHPVTRSRAAKQNPEDQGSRKTPSRLQAPRSCLHGWGWGSPRFL